METYLRIQSMEDVDRLVRSQLEESQGLEYKSALPLDSIDEKKEALKDLSGMGNGGGGTVIFGVDEDPNHLGIPTAITRLTDVTLQGRLDDIVRNSIRPPLIATFRRVEDAKGHVLVADVWPSPLGPYMIEAYRERRYYHRNGKVTAPMNEQQVRDAYMLAARGRDRRPDVWREHRLPIAATSLAGGPCLTVAGLPEAPLTTVLDVPSVTVADLSPPAEIVPSSRFGGVETVLKSISPWADGVYGEAGMFLFRLHRDGAIGFATVFNPGVLDIRYFSRVLHGQLMYMGWLWSTLGIRTPVELRIELHRLSQAQLGYVTPPTVQIPKGVDAMPVPTFTVTHVPWQFERAGIRNAIVWEFLQRIHQAVGQRTAPDWLFKQGWLYRRDGSAHYLHLDDGAVSSPNRELRGRVLDDGQILDARYGKLVAYVRDGVILDPNGDTLAVTEMAVGSGIPDDFKPQSHSDPKPANLLPIAHAQIPVPMPLPIQRWSEQDLATLLNPP